MLLWHENHSHKHLCVYIGRWSEVIEYKKDTIINKLLSSTYWCFPHVLGSWGFLSFLSGMPRSSVSHHILPQWHRQPCLIQISIHAYCPAFRSSLLWGIWAAGVPSSQESVFTTWVRNRLEKVKLVFSFPWNRILGIGKPGQECKTLKNRMDLIPMASPWGSGLLPNSGTLVDWQVGMREGEQCMSQSTGMLLVQINRNVHWNLYPHYDNFLLA